MVARLMRIEPEISIHEDRKSAHDFATRLALGVLETAIAENGQANFMVSGGSTPAATFERLSRTPLDWSRVTVGLVDERWVEVESSASNERLVRQSLLVNNAGGAGFVPMRTMHSNLMEAVADRANAYGQHCQAIDLVFLGMGVDGHTASWFPNSQGLNEALNHPQALAVSRIDATGCPVAGAHKDRITLTGNAIGAARAGILMIFGQEKRDMLQIALQGNAQTYPVKHAIDLLGHRLTIIWAP